MVNEKVPAALNGVVASLKLSLPTLRSYVWPGLATVWPNRVPAGSAKLWKWNVSPGLAKLVWDDELSRL